MVDFCFAGTSDVTSIVWFSGDDITHIQYLCLCIYITSVMNGISLFLEDAPFWW